MMNTGRSIRILFSMLFLSMFCFTSMASEATSTPPQDSSFSVKEKTVREKVIINISDDTNWEYMIFTEEGNCIRMGVLSKGKNKVSLKNMCKGEYFVYLTNGDVRYIHSVLQ